MPCHTITSVKVTVKAMKFDQLRRTLDAMGIGCRESIDGNTLSWGNESYNKVTNELRVTSQSRAQEIVQNYGKQGVKEIAKKFGYLIQPGKSENQFFLVKRSV